ncbi:putative trans-sialidase, Group VIII [Trypanosoma cruzi]|uniref:Trans-sialidase, putative n=2 Tax=Trypanosoma cruzi TaxID=5693 RepID=Q4CR72_TRYCC|nr:trans-sialidase, putative [Trypanosoma cruzi]EAN82774.1 trans-sialidase, putative [Trypanosoma cruzi]PWU90384.1 putative trans-sialidase, Group VIII [Trypanosoma cruzi]PWV20100.1 putative trans-sialidase, Group VIII [Trypanosoma cruzi]RNC43130.1 sialidase-like protein [Trypanosoma cruzi]|eukprot:XP_804625.1 trans-sialidase [Trypanosoma cruzi strain CL Brener]
MLSRVAAVMATHTHNRRRVTGSGGKRKGGREREQQRPNVSRRVFNSTVLLLLVTMMCCNAGTASAGESNVKKAVDALRGIGWEKLDNWKDVPGAGGKYGSIRGPSLVEVQGHVFAIAEAHCKDGGDCSEVGFTGIASKYLGLNVDAGPTEILTANASIFGTDLLKEGSGGINTTNGITRPTTLVIGDSVYVLLGNYSRAKPQVGGTNERGLLLVKGTLTDEGGRKKIVWNETHVVKPHGRGDSRSLTELVGGGGSGAVMRDGTIVFPMQAKNSDEERILLSMSFDPSDKKWELSYTATGKGCRDPTLVKWKEDEYGEELFMMAHCAGGYYDVYSSTLDGVNWNTLGEPINRVWGNSHNRKGYGVQSGSTTAIIEGKEVMLITAPVYAKDNEGGKGRLHLWVTDKARVYDVGPISREADDAAASSLLMRSGNEKLISVYEKKKSDGSYSLVAVSLGKQLERIKSMVKKWKDLDGALQSCRSVSSATVDARKKGMCSDTVPTDGLVGFLSANISENTWKDEYLCVNATVKNGKRMVPNGWTFKGSEAGAVWPVGDMGQTVPYYFANNKFTLVATVSIHEVPQRGSIPLIGVRMNDTSSTVLFGLSYTHEKKWLAIPGNVEYFDGWEPDRTYQVVLQMTLDEWTVFVDQEEIQKTKYNTSLFEEHRISHFYIGGDSKNQSATGGHVTVTNVMLYNKELLGSDLYELNASKVTIPSLGVEEQPTGQVASTDDSVAPESRSEESATSHELTGDDTDEQVEGSVHDLVPAAPSSTVVAGSSVPKPATAAESAGASLPDENIQLSGGEKSPQFTPTGEKESMQRGSDLQTQDLQSAESTEFNDVEGSSESNDTEQTVEEGEANEKSGGTTSSVAVSSDIDAVAAPADGEHQVQQSVELFSENNDVRSTGTGTTGAEQSFSLEARDGNSERTMSSDSSLTPSKSGAETTSAENTDDVSRTEGTEFPVENGEEVPQTVDTASGNASTLPGETEISSKSNATAPSDAGILLENGHYSELAGMALFAESTVHGCVSRVLLLMLLGLWGTAALC